MLKSSSSGVETATTTKTSHTAASTQLCSSASAQGLLVTYSHSGNTSNASSPLGSALNLDEEDNMLDGGGGGGCVATTSNSGVNASPWSIHTANTPSTYDLNWNDVNRLELDFVVYKTLPNIRKQLSPNEV